MSDDFVLDVTRIRDDARRKMAAGPVTDTYGLDKNRVIGFLNDVIATEVVCWLGEHDPTTRRLMESILEEEEEHADDLVDLIGV
ncbi:hypothetical protein ACWGMA_10605 [Streptomyces asiaticus]